MDPQEASSSTGLHPIELCVYSILSNNLDGVYQCVNELRESQALLVLLLKKVRTSVKEELDLYNQDTRLEEAERRLSALTLRVNRLLERYDELQKTSEIGL
ncbi:LAMI_0F09802g1_1 [Lachancea mirantina]|uniref:LAMI_0F09802g1_1 n=1 Tax=Lachancea mirantina TaxID=1230905 RepID=A0A1G4K1E4_9SACH|nr:LAMI_0F09802g1_1 [Lachancea mirantina]